MKKLNYSNFTDLPFAELAELISDNPSSKEQLVTDFIARCGLGSRDSWFLPQLTAYISKLPIPGPSAKDFLALNMRNNAFNQGIYHLCTHRLRGALVPVQSRGLGLDYSALVPLLLMPFKKLNSLPYSYWKDVHLLLDPNLKDLIDFCNLPLSEQIAQIGIEASFYESDTIYTLAAAEGHKEQILAQREDGLKFVSGKNAGKAKNATTSYKLSRSKLPWYVQVTLYQIWVAHPSLRHKYMILDGKNLDNMPEPLITTDVVDPQPQQTHKLPWD